MRQHQDAGGVGEPSRSPTDRPEIAEFRARGFGLRLRDELDETIVTVAREFAAARIEFLLLKGAALARLLYETGEARGYSDVDLLVSPRDLDTARDELRQLGCLTSGGWRGVDDVTGVINSERWLRPGVKSPALGIDLHWRLPGVGASPQRAWDALIVHRMKIDVHGASVPALDRVGSAVHVALHAAQHGPELPKPLADLDRALERWPREVWRDAAALATEIEAVPAFVAGLRLRPAGAVLARELQLPVSDTTEWEIAHREKRPRGTFHLAAWEAARGPGERLDILRRSLFPTRQWLQWEYPGAGERRTRLVAAYARHLARAPIWAARSWWFRRRARRAVG